MKWRIVLILAAVLIALGAIGDHAITAAFSQPTPVASSSRPPSGGSTITTSYRVTASSANLGVTAAAIDAATERAYSLASPSVVYVDNLQTGTGSGIIYDTKGDIVTNNHVVDGSKTLRVTLSDGKAFAASVVGTDSADDLAVIHIQASDLHPASFAPSSAYTIAQTVLAIGSPLGLKDTVTSGLISGVNRVEQEPNGAYLPNALQTSAPINPGNSGGALVTLGGAVVGMPTLEQTSSNNGAAAQNIGFAIPSSRITYVANQIIAAGKVQHTNRAYLGISPTDPSGQSSAPFGGGFGFGQGGNAPPVSGAVVAQVAPNGPAGKAGVQQGDTITAAAGTPVSDAQDLLTVLAHQKPGDTIALKINRSGTTLTVHVHLGELPAS